MYCIFATLRTNHHKQSTNIIQQSTNQSTFFLMTIYEYNLQRNNYYKEADMKTYLYSHIEHYMKFAEPWNKKSGWAV